MFAKTVKHLIVIVLFVQGTVLSVQAQSAARQDSLLANPVDTLLAPEDAVSKRETIFSGGKKSKTAFHIRNEKLEMEKVTNLSFLSVQQMLKGNISGVYVQEPTGEPGTYQNMVVRGLSSPVFSAKDISGVQPVIYLNGIPIIQDHPFVYDIQQNELNPVGPATNILAGLNLANIISVEIVKDPLELAKLGPLAANGAVLITTADGYTRGPHVAINTFAGFAAPPLKISPTNAAYERTFRESFFSRYNIANPEQYMPDYIKDTENENYFGKPDWADSYYRYAPQYSVNASIGGGGSSADYLFSAGITNSPGVADDTYYQKYNISYFINMTPFDGLLMRCMLNGSRGQRGRNRNFTDRLAEIEYLPNLSLPIAPAGDAYRSYLTNYKDNGIDDNISNMLNGYLDLSYTSGKLKAGAKMLVDYNAHTRHFFLPSTLFEYMSYVSEYSGYNRRIVGEGTVDYSFNLNTRHRFNLGWLGSITTDGHNYNFIKGYDGANDEYKTSKNGNYKLYRYKDHETANLVSTAFTFNYKYSDLLDLGLVVRYDGSSNVPANSRWIFTPAVSAKWNLKNQFLDDSEAISGLSLGASFARIGKLIESDRFATGPQYASEDLSWMGQSAISSYGGYPSITRSYARGWVGYEPEWPVADKTSMDLAASFLDNRLNIALSLYSNTDKNMMIRQMTPLEFGYKYLYLIGMDINNSGADVNISADIFAAPRKFAWNVNFNMNYNKNVLKQLPGGLDELIVDERKLKTGEAVDRFWVYENRGIYNSAGEAPSKNGVRLSIDGTAFGAGDPAWADLDDNNVIDKNDKTLKGHAMPVFTGGMTNTFKYGGFDFSFHLFFAAGHSALNTRDHQRYDFGTSDGLNSIDKAREIYFWQNTAQKDDYPIYHPLSGVHPYRADQDLFLESLSYLKLRSVTIGYNIPMKNSMYVYITANNLFTLSGFSGGDPELTGFNGYYTGITQPLPKSILAGIRFKF